MTPDPILVEYFEQLGWESLSFGDLDRARASFAECIRLAIASGSAGTILADAYIGMGQCLMEEDNRLYAARFFQKALELGPSVHLRPVTEQFLAVRA